MILQAGPDTVHMDRTVVKRLTLAVSRLITLPTPSADSMRGEQVLAFCSRLFGVLDKRDI